MCKKEEQDMLDTLLIPKKTKELSSENLRISESTANKLVEKKTTIFCKDGIAQIDSSHPDYKFWMED